jgi:hypothetical protein
VDDRRRQALQPLFGLAASFATVFIEGHGRLLLGIVPEPMIIFRTYDAVTDPFLPNS